MEDLTDGILLRIIGSANPPLGLEDLLKASRVSKRWHHLVQSCDQAWAALYELSFGGSSSSISLLRSTSSTSQGSALQRFRQRYTVERREERLKRKVLLIQVQSRVQGLERELIRLRSELHAEQDRQAANLQELQQLARARQAQQAVQAWQPQALQQHYNRVLQQTPIDSHWRTINLEQENKVSELRISSIKNSMHARRSQLAAECRRLDSLQV